MQHLSHYYQCCIQKKIGDVFSWGSGQSLLFSVNILCPEYALSRTFFFSYFFLSPISTLGNCPYKFVRHLEPRYPELSLCRTIFSVPSALFSIRYLEPFHFTHLNGEIIYLKILIEC